MDKKQMMDNGGFKPFFFIFFALLLVSCVSAESDANDPSGEFIYNYYMSQLENVDFSAGNCDFNDPTCYNEGYFKIICIPDIESVKKLYWYKYSLDSSVIFYWATKGASPETQSATASFTMNCGGTEVGKGSIIIFFRGESVWLMFSEFSPAGLTGTQSCDIVHNHAHLENYCIGTAGGIADMQNTCEASGDWIIKYGWVVSGDEYCIEGDALIQYGEYWENRVEWDTKEVANLSLTTLNFSRTFGDFEYNSTPALYSTPAEGEFDISGDYNYSTMLYSYPISYSLNDPLGKWHNQTLMSGVSSFGDMFGYVYEADQGFLVPGADVCLGVGGDSQCFTTGSGGLYGFNLYDVAVGTEAYLNCSKEGYENSSDVISLVYGGRYDIVLFRNVTVYSGTSTVYGVVRDLHSFEALGGVLVKLTNSTYSESTVSGERGGFYFYNVTGTGYYDVIGSLAGYESGSVTVNVSSMGSKYPVSLYLLNSSDIEPGATPTPEPGVVENPFIGLFDLLGLSEFFGWIMAIIIIGVLAGVMSYLTKDATATMLGAFFGFLISVFAGFLPSWLLVIAIIGSGVFFRAEVGSHVNINSREALSAYLDEQVLLLCFCVCVLGFTHCTFYLLGWK